MLTRSLTASVLPRRGRPRATTPRWRAALRRLEEARRRSLLIQQRMEADRIRYAERHGHGLR
ncbi:MAG: hypothetical protein ACRDLT_14690 [Solirubrobacteraceae bacterium]